MILMELMKKTWIQTTQLGLELNEMENDVKRYIARCWMNTRLYYTSGIKGQEVVQVTS